MDFNFFSKKYSFLDGGIFDDATDLHCHILPGVDDGIPTMKDALNVLAYYEQVGIREVWLTPHVLEDMPNTTANLRLRYEELQREYNGGITLHLAAENMVDGQFFLERLEADDVLTIGNQGDHLLIEFSYLQPPLHFFDTIKKIQEKGLTPILAHPERYSYMSIEEYQLLKKKGCKLQMNVTSLIGAYGSRVQKKAQAMLSMGLYDFCGTDLHSLCSFKQAAQQKKLNKDMLRELYSLSHHKL